MRWKDEQEVVKNDYNKKVAKMKWEVGRKH